MPVDVTYPHSMTVQFTDSMDHLLNLTTQETPLVSSLFNEFSQTNRIKFYFLFLNHYKVS